VNFLDSGFRIAGDAASGMTAVYRAVTPVVLVERLSEA